MAKNAVEDQEELKQREAEQHQQPLPVEGEPAIIQYERPLPVPGDKDYIAGQPVDDVEADEVEAEVTQRLDEARARRDEEQREREANQQNENAPRRRRRDD
jgi:hypothetical protein